MRVADAGPRVVHEAERVYLDDAAGVRWRVHWVHFGPPLAAPHKRRRLTPGDRRANYLWFVDADGGERCAPLARDADRAITAAVLAGYLARAGVPARPWQPPPSRGVLGS